MSSKTKVLYIGMTNNLARRIYEHKHKLIPGFTVMDNGTKLVYSEMFSDDRQAIAGETSPKGWIRSKKITLIETLSKEWKDLSSTLDVY